MIGPVDWVYGQVAESALLWRLEVLAIGPCHPLIAATSHVFMLRQQCLDALADLEAILPQIYVELSRVFVLVLQFILYEWPNHGVERGVRFELDYVEILSNRHGDQLLAEHFLSVSVPVIGEDYLVEK